MNTTTEPSVARWASLLLGALSVAYGALTDWRDCGYTHTEEATGYLTRFGDAIRAAEGVYQQLAESAEALAAAPEVEPILEAIALTSGEVARLCDDAVERTNIDLRFIEIINQLKPSSD